jgi:hypothetical protein
MLLPDVGVIGRTLVRVLPVPQRENLLIAHGEEIGKVLTTR